MREFKIGDYVTEPSFYDKSATFGDGIIIDVSRQNKWHKQKVKIEYYNRKNTQGTNVISWTGTDFISLHTKTLREDKLKILLDETN